MKDADEFDEYDDGSLFGYAVEKFYDEQGFLYARKMKRREVVHAPQARDIPLDTMPHYSDPRYSSGKAHLVFGVENYSGKYGSGGWDYSDRIWQWDWNKADAASKTADASGHTKRTANWYEAYLTAYFGRPVHLFGIMAGVNVSNGYPYQVFGYVFKDKADE